MNPFAPDYKLAFLYWFIVYSNII